MKTSPDRRSAHPALVRSGSGPLGALPDLSSATRRALAGVAVLATANAAAVVVIAVALASALALVVAGRPDRIADWLLLLGSAVLARSVFGWATATVAASAAAGAKEELRAALLDSALAHGPEWITDHGPAELTALATKGIDALDGYFTRYLPALVTSAVAPLAVGLWILVTDWRSAVLVAITLPLIPLFAILIGRYTQRRADAAAAAAARLAGHLLELLRALPVLTAFGRAPAQDRAVRRVSEAHRKATTATLRVAFSSALALEVIATLSVALVAVDIGLRLVGGSLGLATGLTVLILAPECYLPLRAAGAAFHASEDGLAAARRVAELRDVGAEGSPGTAGVHPEDLRHRLDVRDLVVLRRDRNAPDGVSFTVRPGEITRLDSPSGAGKSTIMAVLLGFTEPSAGMVTIGGVDLSTLDMDAWRRCVAAIPQRPRFAASTVAGELRAACGDSAPPTEAELRDAVREVAATHLLHRTVDELSTGERQRIAVARALLRLRHGAWLLLADEPTAHLDETTAATVGAALRTAAERGAAVLLATHRDLPDRPAVPAPVPETADAEPELPPERVSPRSLVTWRTVGGALLGAAALGCGVALTGTAAVLIARASQHPPILTLSVLIVAVRAFGLGKGVLRYAERLVSHDAAFRLSGDLRVRLWRAVVRLGPARSATLRRTDGLRRLVDDTDTVRDLVPRVVQPPLVAAIVAVGAIIVQTIVLPTAGLVLAGALLVAGVAGPVIALGVERRSSAALAAGRRWLAGAVLTLLDTAPDLIACGAHRVRRTELAAVDRELVTRARRQALGAGVAAGLTTGALGVAALLCTLLAAAAVAAGRLDPVLAPLPALLPLALAETVDGLAPALAQLDVLRTAYGRVRELVDTPARPPTGAGSSPDGDIVLAGVRTSWPGAAGPALDDLTVRIPAGSRVAVLGPSGAGKSTLLALLLGFLPVDAGTARLPERISWCPQDPQLVSTTVRENLRVGRPDATDDELRAALRDVALDGWADRLDVPLGPGGATVSGGEARRLALARALLGAREADVVLLDEPTAHLDVPTANRILATLGERLAGRTVVYVTHRPDEAAGADVVIDVMAGHVRAHGREPLVAAPVG